MTEKRFTTDNGSHEDVCLVDNLTKKEYESNFEDMVSLMNDIWNQTQRFEKHNQRLEKENEQLKEHLSTWRSSCCNYLNVYSILDNEVSILKETKDLDRFFEKFDKYSRMPFYEVEKSFIELQKENEQLKQQLKTKVIVNKQYEELQRLKKENKQLKMGIDSLKLLVQNWEALDEEKDEQLDRQNQALKKLKKENDELKKELEKND